MNVNVFEAKAQGHAPDVMPWGKHKGKPLKEVPRDYLKWALNNADAMSAELRAAIEAELGLIPGVTTPGEKTPMDDLRDLLAETRRKLKEAEKHAADLELQLKSAEANARAAARDAFSDADVFRRIVKQWFGAMSRKFHPDMGGSVEKQVIVNACYRDLIGRLEGACEATGQPSSGASGSRTRAPW